MDLPEENTVVLNMMGEFNTFLSNKFGKKLSVVLQLITLLHLLSI